jgi:phosphoglycolate phosphatase
MRFKAVIFDLDGTLLDSLEGIADAMNRLLEGLGYPVRSLDEYRYFVGEGIQVLVGKALPEAWHRDFQTGTDKEAALESLVKEYRRLYEETWRPKSPPHAGVPQLLETLGKDHIKISVLSNKSDDFTKRMVSELLPGRSFEAVVGSRPGVPQKPAPTSSLEIAGIMKTHPGDIVFLGDSGVDMQTAVNAGMVPVGVLWGFREAKELLDSGAQHLIKHPLELLEIMRQERGGAQGAGRKRRR